LLAKLFMFAPIQISLRKMIQTTKNSVLSATLPRSCNYFMLSGMSMIMCQPSGGMFYHVV